MSLPQKNVIVRGRRFRVKVEDSSDPSAYLKYEDLRDAVWDFPEDHLSGSRNMLCENVWHEGSSLFISAFTEDGSGRLAEDGAHLAGFSYGFVGVRDKTVFYKTLENLWFYSQFTAVRPEFEGYGLGILIKELQREIVLGILGITRVVCTFDPLTGVNAHRNIRRFGMDVLEYRVSTYGAYGGRLNRTDVATDRFFMSWDLTKERSRNDLRDEGPPGPGENIIEVAVRTVAGRSGPVVFETAAGNHLGAFPGTAFVRIPYDFYGMLRETDVADPDVRRIPRDWRTATRDVFRTLFDRGYGVVDFRTIPGPRPANYYILKK